MGDRRHGLLPRGSIATGTLEMSQRGRTIARQGIVENWTVYPVASDWTLQVNVGKSVPVVVPSAGDKRVASVATGEAEHRRGQQPEDDHAPHQARTEGQNTLATKRFPRLSRGTPRKRQSCKFLREAKSPPVVPQIADVLTGSLTSDRGLNRVSLARASIPRTLLRET